MRRGEGFSVPHVRDAFETPGGRSPMLKSPAFPPIWTVSLCNVTVKLGSLKSPLKLILATTGPFVINVWRSWDTVASSCMLFALDIVVV